MLHLVVLTQSVKLHIFLTLGKVQTVASRQHFAHLLVSESVILIAYRPPVIIHSIIDDVAVRMVAVDVSGNDKLGVLDTHQLHIVVGYCEHQFIIVCEPCHILRREVQRYVSDCVFDLIVEQRLQLKLLCHFRG